MSTAILLKRSGTASTIPNAADLDLGELALNYADGVLYYKNDQGQISAISGSGSGGGNAEINIIKKTADYTAFVNDFIITDTSGGSFTITLPANPLVGNYISIYDGDDWSQNNLIVDGNGRPIEGVSNDTIEFDIGNIRVDFVWDGTQWELFAHTGPIGPQGISITDAEVDGNGDLIITLSDGSTINAGGSPSGTITDDNVTNADQYIAMVRTTSGEWSDSYVASTQLYFNPSTGTLTTTNVNTLSDAALKDNVNPLDDVINIINKINPVSFSWKQNDAKAYGVIAQEIEKVLPELVETNNNGIKSVAYQQLIPILLQSVKELWNEIQTLKSTDK